MKKYIIIFVSAFLIFSCNDDVLDLDNPNNYSENTYYKNSDECIKAVNAIYGGFYFMYAREYYFMFDLLGNDGEKKTALNPQIAVFSSFTYDKTTEFINNLWRSLYRMVLRANLAERKITEWETKTDEEAELRIQLIGEAKFLRAWSYFKLVTLWGRVPLRKSWDDKAIQNISRSSVESIYAFIEEDLKDAASKLPVSHPVDIGRVTKGASVALLGKVLLYQGKYAEAENELKKLDGSEYSYSLADNYETNFVEDGDNNSESVFEVQHGFFVGDNYWYMFGGEETWGGSAIHTGRAKEYDFTSWNNLKISKTGAKAFTYKDETNSDYTDPRAYMVFYNAPGENYYGGDTDYAGGNYPESAGLSWRKYQNLETIPSEPNPSSGINSKIIRFSDVLLLWAEALIEQNKVTDALPLINRVRARVGAFEYTTLGTQAEAMEKLKHERQLELFGEQQRWFDIVRWDDLDVLANEKKDYYGNSFSINDKYYLFPIPENEKKYNTEVANDISNDWN
uniref:RagB/SusD family nutrient uptake outer membrane protein n=1 Tax=uncultured Draconibacterium sp. TaxID=1573823 RepID=UPI0032164E0B